MLHPLTGEAVVQVLPDEAMLAEMFSQPFKLDKYDPPRIGGPEALGEGYSDDGRATPRECIGVVAIAQRAAYPHGGITDVAQRFWTSADRAQGAQGVWEVATAVVAFDSDVTADAVFERFSRQWSQCDGTAVSVSNKYVYTETISEVHAAHAVVTADVVYEHPVAGSDRSSRAIGVRDNCIVDVRVTFDPKDSRSRTGADLTTAGHDVATAMMERIAALT